MLHPCGRLQERCHLLATILVQSFEEVPHRRMRTHKKRLNAMVPPFDNICRSRNPVSSGRVLIPAWNRVEGWAVVLTPPAHPSTPDVRMFEISNSFIFSWGGIDSAST